MFIMVALATTADIAMPITSQVGREVQHAGPATALGLSQGLSVAGRQAGHSPELVLPELVQLELVLPEPVLPEQVLPGLVLPGLVLPEPLRLEPLRPEQVELVGQALGAKAVLEKLAVVHTSQNTTKQLSNLAISRRSGQSRLMVGSSIL